MNEKNIEKEKRTEKITINLTKSEKQEIVRLSKKYGLRMSPFLRFKGLSDFIISSKTKSIERLKKVPTKEDPLMSEMKSGFSAVIQEIRTGFKENRKFLKPIPPLEKVEILKEKQKRMKEVSNLI